MSDLAVFQDSLDVNNERTPFISKEVLYCQDQQNGNYNGQIIFETSQLENSGRWLDYSNGYIQIPFVIACKSEAKNTDPGVLNSYISGLKAGTHHLIDSCTIDINNTTVVQQQSYLNFYTHYKMMTTWSQDDVAKWGGTTLFIPDDVDSFNSESGANFQGNTPNTNNRINAGGNNLINYTTLTGQNNYGYKNRLEITGFGYNDAAEIKYPNAGGGTFGPDEAAVQPRLNALCKNHLEGAGVNDETRTIYWKIMATIRLRDLSDIFDKMPLTRGTRVRITLRYNSSSFRIVKGAADSAQLTLNIANQLTGNTCPIMVSGTSQSPVLTSGIEPLRGLSGNAILVTCGIRNTTIDGVTVTNSMLSTCRLYVDSFEMDPVQEEEFLRRFPEKEIVYDDIYQFSTDVASGDNFNSLVSNGESNLQKVVVIPMNNAATAGANQWQTPFDSCPGTTLPCGALTNFNVQLGGKNVLSDYEQYDFQQFLDELSKDNAYSNTVGLSNGLLNHHNWDVGYRYYVVDVARRIPADDVLSKSVSIIGRNGTAVNMKLFVFLVKKKSLTLNMRNGAIVAGP